MPPLREPMAQQLIQDKPSDPQGRCWKGLTFQQPTLILAAASFGSSRGIKANHRASSCTAQGGGSTGALGLEPLLPRAVHRGRRVHGAFHTLAWYL